MSTTGWPSKKILDFRWSKKAKITLEIKDFGETFLSVFLNFFHFYNIMKTCRQNLISFSKFTNAFLGKEKKQSSTRQ